jgi:hypothetical protein
VSILGNSELLINFFKDHWQHVVDVKRTQLVITYAFKLIFSILIR